MCDVSGKQDVQKNILFFNEYYGIMPVFMGLGIIQSGLKKLAGCIKTSMELKDHEKNRFIVYSMRVRSGSVPVNRKQSGHLSKTGQSQCPYCAGL